MSGAGHIETGPSYFYEDEVCRTTKSGEIEYGMVLENWEMYSSSEEDDDDSDPTRVPRGHVSVNWHPKGKEETVKEAKVSILSFISAVASSITLGFSLTNIVIS
jgi:hypothetical protein